VTTVFFVCFSATWVGVGGCGGNGGLGGAVGGEGVIQSTGAIQPLLMPRSVSIDAKGKHSAHTLFSRLKQP